MISAAFIFKAQYPVDNAMAARKCMPDKLGNGNFGAGKELIFERP